MLAPTSHLADKHKHMDTGKVRRAHGQTAAWADMTFPHVVFMCIYIQTYSRTQKQSAT